jgi:hypothetical protein
VRTSLFMDFTKRFEDRVCGGKLVDFIVIVLMDVTQKKRTQQPVIDAPDMICLGMRSLIGAIQGAIKPAGKVLMIGI